MAQIRGTAGYNLGAQHNFGGPGRADATNDPSPLDAIREQTSKIEDALDTYSDPIKPYVSTQNKAMATESRGGGIHTRHTNELIWVPITATYPPLDAF